MVTIEPVLDDEETKAELEQLKSYLLKACEDIETISSSSCLSSSSQQRSTNKNNGGGTTAQRTQTAAAVGGLMFSLVNDLTSAAKNNSASRGATTGTNNNRPSMNNLWNNALQVIEKTKEIHQAERSFKASDDIQISYLVGDTAKATGIGFVIHGFMTSEEKDVAHLWDDWASTLNMVLYRIWWPTGNMESWNQLLQKLSSSTSGNGITTANFAQTLLASNPFHVAQDVTFHVAQVLSRFLEQIDRTNNNNDRRQIVLIGHSLGAAIAYQTLLQERTTTDTTACSDNDTLTTSDTPPSPLVDHIVSLGGAFIPKVEDIHKSLTQIGGKFINVYSKNDQVLQVGYRAANFTAACPAGIVPLLTTHQLIDEASRRTIFDLDMSAHIPMEEGTLFGHYYAGDTLHKIATKIKDLLV